ncbi:hypothetical protein BpHYR1_042336 [Brachionus plicatilis]|uniref:Uncharacterized protein n=1 Tax=Brachionus plicatilis TaxID=10195 RepID=A0A3M7SUG3_BRAPC|nr:hypothetical protein BpHYR1_042336 [Brachionus plicatilis]
MYPNPAQVNDGMTYPTVPSINTNIPLMSPEQQNHYVNEMKQQERAYFEKRIKEEYPVKYPIVYSAILVFNSISLIALHVILIIFKGAFHYVYHGIWGGVLTILLTVLILLPIKIHNVYVYMAAIFGTVFIGMFISMGVLLASAISFMDYGSDYASEEANKDMIPVSAVMIALSAVSVILSVVNFFLIKKIAKRPKVNMVGHTGIMVQQNVPAYSQQNHNMANNF